jgi:hypothetical protein
LFAVDVRRRKIVVCNLLDTRAPQAAYLLNISGDDFVCLPAR